MVEARLGNQPWDVFHQGMARRTGLTFGTVRSSSARGAAAVDPAAPAARHRHGRATWSSSASASTCALAVLPTPVSAGGCGSRSWSAACCSVRVATGLYIGARLGPGPRDGLMTGLAARGHSIRVVRTVIEVTVVAVGFLLGGTVGVGTIVYALAIGPLVHMILPLFTVDTPAEPPTARLAEAEPVPAPVPAAIAAAAAN